MRECITQILREQMKSQEVLNRLLIAEKYFLNTKYDHIVLEASRLYNINSIRTCDEVLNKLPTEKDLLKALLEKLKGKSVFKTLKKIQESKQLTSFTELKGLTSLLTHILIECEKKSEYKLLVPSILQEINKVTYNVL
jgi:hypothetical protein